MRLLSYLKLIKILKKALTAQNATPRHKTTRTATEVSEVPWNDQ